MLGSPLVCLQSTIQGGAGHPSFAGDTENSTASAWLLMDPFRCKGRYSDVCVCVLLFFAFFLGAIPSLEKTDVYALGVGSEAFWDSL